ncbi:hypothetical protein DVA67_017515 [Solirubrobacter sp. CPCC 204708]|uniref:PLL-like beta propeller domain-containing protein n=1 Tax=Solirubrobacter deserti TaxID=2282478 RepID=A0ABT4RD39_9ACTN|nr:hypothetical protein [Solirubrobacter deserti]MBE2317785.1 hypothetical protein [Solirubrobacter deserti]MDA0136438.1 hypothetical protein [Solirubrobacter deserti]
MLRAAALVVLCFAAFAGSASADVFDDNPAAVATGPGAVTVYVRGADGGLLARSSADGAWGPWTAVPGLEAGSGPAAVRYGSSTMLFVRGAADSQLWTNTLTDGAWSGWLSLGGSLVSAPAAALRAGSTTVDVVARGTNNLIVRREFVGGGSGWGPWGALSTPMTAGPAATGTVYEGLSASNVLARGEDGGLRSIHLNGTAQPWADLGGFILGSPASASAAPNVIDVFARAGDSTLHHRPVSGGAWRRVDTQRLSSSPAAVSDTPGRELTFARVGSEIWTMTVTRAGTDTPAFGPWSSLGVPSPPGPPAPPPGPTDTDTDADGVPDPGDRCSTTPGAPSRSGCPAGLRADPSIRYRVVRGGIRVVAYYVKATRGPASW